jgi:hypothetical protein
MFRCHWVVWYYIRMLTYFDECYDGNHSYLILGALYNPSVGKVHENFLKRKQDEKYFKTDGTSQEIKYNYCVNNKRFRIARSAVDCFKESSSFFRAIVIDQRPQSGFNLDYFGRPDEPKKIKDARAYKKFTELLLKSNISFTNGVLLTDRISRPRGDAFLSLVREDFGTAGAKYSRGKNEPIFRHIQEVDTALEQYHVGQIGDILQGVILNQLVPAGNKFKRKIREYVEAELALPSLGQDYWLPLSKSEQDVKHQKYQIWYWKPGD